MDNTKNPKTSQNTQSNLNSAGKKVTQKVGDSIEKVGDFVGNKVSKKAGDAIRNFGDKIEHSGD